MPINMQSILSLAANNDASTQAFYAGRGRTEYLTVDHAEGVYFWDINGKQYFDGSSGAVCSILGHGNNHVRQAMLEQSEKVTYIIRTAFASEPSEKLVKACAELAGPGFDQTYLVSGGSEGVEAALKLARQYAFAKGEKSRCIVLSRMPGYHGATLGAAAVTGDPDREVIFGPMMTVMPKVPAPFTYRFPENFDGHTVDSYSDYCANQLEEQILAAGPENVLAFIMEPVGGVATGALVPPDSYYTKVRSTCDKYGVLLIFDEVMSGTARCGKFLAAHHWPDALPDIAIIAKGLGAGYTPLGAVLAPNRIVDTVVEFGGFLHGHTYSGNPLSSAIGYAVIEEIIRMELMENSLKMGALLRAKLVDVMNNSTVIGDVRGLGLLNAIEVVADKETKEVFKSEDQATYRLAEIARKHGLQIYSRRAASGRYGEWLMATPPLIVNEKEIEEYVGLITRTFDTYEKEIGRK